MFKMTNETYDLLKYIAMYILPALATLVSALGKIWGIPYYVEVSATLMALDTFMGVCLGISSSAYYDDEDEDDLDAY